MAMLENFMGHVGRSRLAGSVDSAIEGGGVAQPLEKFCTPEKFAPLQQNFAPQRVASPPECFNSHLEANKFCNDLSPKKLTPL